MQPLQIMLRGLDIADKTAFAERTASVHSFGALRATARLAGVYALAGGAFGLCVCLFADSILWLAYGAKFAGESGPLMAWVPVFILLACMMPVESLVYARRSFKSYYLARALGSLTAIALTWPLVLHFSETGAILASGAGALVAACGAMLFLKRGSVR